MDYNVRASFRQLLNYNMFHPPIDLADERANIYLALIWSIESITTGHILIIAEWIFWGALLQKNMIHNEFTAEMSLLCAICRRKNYFWLIKIVTGPDL